MYLLMTSKTRTVRGPDTFINCPECGDDSPALTYQRVERMGIFFVPFLTQRETFVVCETCGKTSLIKLPLEQLGELSADEVSRHLHARVAIVAKFLALAGLLLSLVPVVGLTLSGIGLAMTYRAGGWAKVASLIGLGISALVVGAIAVMLIFQVK